MLKRTNKVPTFPLMTAADMKPIYAIVYGHEITGTMLVGPNTGKVYDRAQMCLGHFTAESALAKTTEYRQMVDGTVRTISRQWIDGQGMVITYLD